MLWWEPKCLIFVFFSNLVPCTLPYILESIYSQLERTICRSWKGSSSDISTELIILSSIQACRARHSRHTTYTITKRKEYSEDSSKLVNFFYNWDLYISGLNGNSPHWLQSLWQPLCNWKLALEMSILWKVVAIVFWLDSISFLLGNILYIFLLQFRFHLLFFLSFSCLFFCFVESLLWLCLIYFSFVWYTSLSLFNFLPLVCLSLNFPNWNWFK